MKMKEKKMREELEKANIALAMSNRRHQQQTKIIERLNKELEEQRNLNFSL